MFLLYIYATIAGLGLLGLPSYGVWFCANHVLYGCDRLRRRTYGDDEMAGIDWWDVGYSGKCIRGAWDDTMPYPVILGISIIIWPLILSYYISKHGYLISSKVLAMPGKMIVRRELEKKQASRFLEAGHREVEKFLASK
jgi:hypothetical protein